MTRGMRCSSRVRPARPGERATIESTFHFAIVPFRHARIPSAPRALRLTSSDVRPLFPAATRAETFVRKMEAAQTKLWRAVRREVSRASRVGPSDSSAASVSSGDDAGLSPEFVAAAHAVNAALARAVADEVEEQLTDVLMCLGEESTKARILEHALTRFDVHVPSLLREAGYSPGNSPPGSRGASPAARDAAARDAPFSWDGAGDGAGDGHGSPALYAHLLPPDTWRGGERGPSFAKSARNEDVSPEPGLAALRALSASRLGFSSSSSVERTAFQTATPGGTASTASALGLDGNRGSGEPPSPVEAVAAEARASATAASFDRAEAARRKNRGDDDDDDDDANANANANANADAIAATVSDGAKAAGLGTPPEEEGARPASLSEDWDTSEEEEDAEEDLGYSSFSSESSLGGPRANRRAAYVTDAPEDVRAVSRRARQRARARLEVGPGVGPNILEGYYGGDSVFFPKSEETVARGAGAVPPRAETRAGASGALGFVADEDGESRSMLYVPGEGVPGDESVAPGVLIPPRGAPGDAAAPGTARRASAGTAFSQEVLTGDVGAALFRRVAGTVRAAARVARPALMTMPVRQRHWMEIYESTF